MASAMGAEAHGGQSVGWETGDTSLKDCHRVMQWISLYFTTFSDMLRCLKALWAVVHGQILSKKDL